MKRFVSGSGCRSRARPEAGAPDSGCAVSEEMRAVAAAAGLGALSGPGRDLHAENILITWTRRRQAQIHPGCITGESITGRRSQIELAAGPTRNRRPAVEATSLPRRR